MATKLQCPQCHSELPASFARGEAGVCPGCSKSFVAPKVQLARKKPVARAQAYLPPKHIPLERPSVGKWTAGILVVALLLGVGGVFAMTRHHAPEDTTKQQPAVVSALSQTQPVSPASKPGAKAVNDAKMPGADKPPQDPVDTVSTTMARPRPVPKIEPTLNDAPPIALTEFKPAGPQKMKAFSDAVDQEKVDEAIRKGIDYFKTNRTAWLANPQHPLGVASLGGLALLESGVPGDDAVIQDALKAVRKLGPKSAATYEISLAILFLDKYADPIDEPLIRTLGLRLVAGQTQTYGWTYNCPILSMELETPLYKLLSKIRPQGQWQVPLAREQGKGLIDLAIPLAKAPDRIAMETPLETKPVEPAPSTKKDDPDLVMPFVLGDPKKIQALVKLFPEQIRNLPVVQGLDPTDHPPMPAPKSAPPGKGKKKFVRPNFAGSHDDNSNTQFAMLGLWAARRHGVPVERSLLLADQRFASSQGPSGTWGYHVQNPNGSPAMTCVGLLGLALGHGALFENRDAKKDPNQPAPRAAGDPAIQKGLEALGRNIGEPNQPMPGNGNLYFLWSVERVAMLYQLKTIGGKDWYGWGANHLIKTQAGNGSWFSNYPGSHTPPVDTAFALLFLHRSNLVPDLTERLQLLMPIVDQDRK